MEETIEKIRALGADVRRELDSDLLVINEEMKASLVICRCMMTQAGQQRWKIRLDSSLLPDITIAVRMDTDNKTPLDYYLLPALDIENPKIRLAENNGLALDAYRFDDLEPFFYLTERVPVRGIA